MGIDVLKQLNELYRLPDYTIYYYLLEMKARGVIIPRCIFKDSQEDGHYINFLEAFRNRPAEEWFELLKEIKKTDKDFCNKYSKNTKYFLPMACDGGDMLFNKSYNPKATFEENIGEFIAEDVAICLTNLNLYI